MGNNRIHNDSIADYIKRTAVLVFGLFVFSFGIYLAIQADIGLAPWEAFSMGISYASGISFGNTVLITGLAILLIDVAFKEKIGIGTILNTVLIGQFTDFFIAADIVPKADNFWLGVVMMLAGQFLLSIGSYFYIKTALGCGPRDSLMVALAKMAGRLPVGAVRGLIEGSVLLIGWLLGAKIGAGTVIAVFGIGLILEWTFRMFSFDVKSVVHESVFDSFARIRSAARRENG